MTDAKFSQAMHVDNLINPIRFLKMNVICEICKLVLFDTVACKRCQGRFHQCCAEKYVSETGECPNTCTQPIFKSID